MRLIDADAVIARVAGQMSYEIETETGEKPDCIDLAEELLNDIPTIDAVSVVRCGECKHSEVIGKGLLRYCNKSVIPMIRDKDDYCSWGERGEQND